MCVYTYIHIYIYIYIYIHMYVHMHSNITYIQICMYLVCCRCVHTQRWDCAVLQLAAFGPPKAGVSAQCFASCSLICPHRSGWISTLQSRASGLQSTTQGNSSTTVVCRTGYHKYTSGAKGGRRDPPETWRLGTVRGILHYSDRLCL